MGVDYKPRRWRRSTSFFAATLLMTAGFVWGAQSSFAVHDTGMFELDGNIVHDSANTPPYDWADLFGAGGAKLITPDPNVGPVLASTFVDDTDAVDTTYFAGGTKIDDQIHNMSCGGPAANDKTSMDYVYAALIQIPATAPDNAGDQVLYLGLEKQAAGNGGDNAFGFWLYKDNTVGCSGSGTFSGAHTDGDLFIDGTFTNGGGASNVEVFRWNGNDITGSLGAAPVTTGNVCGVVANDTVCGIANSAAITSGAWRASSTMAANTFVEAGIDMTDVLGTAGGCFSTFLADSQSSQSTNSQPKDFAGGQFSTCVPPSIDTAATPGGSLNPTGVADQHDVATISAVGGRPAPTGTVSFFLCDPSQVTAGGCVTGGTQVGGAVNIAAGSATSDNASGLLTTTTGKYCWRADYAPDVPASSFYSAGSETNAGTECFTVVHGTPTIATQIAVTGANQPGLGFTTLGDSATLTNFVGSVAGETISFNLYGPFGTGATPVCSANTVIAAAATTGALNAGGTATTSQTYVPTAAGTYVWVASYPGDTLNDAVAGKCTDANESVTVIGAQIDVAKSANPPGPVSAGETIGFDLTVTNDGSVPALGVHVHDVLPAGADGVAGGDLNWTLDPAYTDCAITGAPGSQLLDCNFNQVNGPGALPVIHISSSTTQADCGVVKNKATITTTNGTGTDSDVATVTVLCPQLTIGKTADAASVSVGSDIGFTVTISNIGAGTATNVDVEDPLPTGQGISWSIDTSTGPLSCAITAGTLKCTGSLVSGGPPQVVHITSPTVWNANLNSCGTYTNIASVSAGNADSPPPATASEDVLCPDLTISKKADATAVNAGTAIGFTITAKNSNAPGTGSAAGVTINDPLPAGTGISWSIDSQSGNACAITVVGSTQTLHCDIGVLAPNGSYSVHITSNTQFLSCADYHNVATLSASNEPSQTADDTTSVLCASLVIHKDADPSPVNVGSDIGFTVTITNTGDGAAGGVDVEDPLPAGEGVSWSVDSASGPLSCSVTGAPPNEVLKCTGDLAASGDASGNDVQTVHVTSSTVWNADLNSCGTYDNTATVSWGNGPTDPISSNQASEVVQCPALGIIKHADDETVSAGDNIGFSIHITQGGPGTATGVTLHDPLPGAGDVSWFIDPDYSGPGTCSISGAVGSQVLDCAFGDLAPNADITIHITSLTTQNSCFGYDNTATLHATNEPGLESSDSTAVLCPDVSLTKTPDADTVNAGESIGFTITAMNSAAAGTGTAKGVAINDPLPGGAGIDWSIDPATANCSITGSAPSQTLECTGVELAPGDSEVVHLVSGTAFESCATYDNTATLTLTNGVPPDPANASVEVQCSSLSLAKTADNNSVAAGKQIGFTITIANGGPGTALGGTLNDPLPKGDGVSWSIDTGATTAGGCDVSNVLDTQVLTCGLGDLDSGVSLAVHLVSGTTNDSCASYHNVATLDATNAPEQTADADTSVTTCHDIQPTPTHSQSPAVTGAGPVQSELGLVILLLGAGGLLLLLGRRRRPGGRHA